MCMGYLKHANKIKILYILYIAVLQQEVISSIYIKVTVIITTFIILFYTSLSGLTGTERRKMKSKSSHASLCFLSSGGEKETDAAAAAAKEGH